MLLYAIIMLLAAGLVAGLGVAVYRGRTDLIHSYHQTQVKDKAAYGKAFGKALLVFAVAMLLSGVIALLDTIAAGNAVAVLLVGMGAGIVCLIIVQRKHNGSVF